MVGRCGGDSAEDLRHFMVECPAYDHIRDRFADVFAYDSGFTVEEWLQEVFAGDHQGQLARCVFEMDMLRRFLWVRALLGVHLGSSQSATFLQCNTLVACRREQVCALAPGLPCYGAQTLLVCCALHLS